MPSVMNKNLSYEDIETDENNCRPISLLHVSGKSMESVVLSTITEHVTGQGLGNRAVASEDNRCLETTARHEICIRRDIR